MTMTLEAFPPSIKIGAEDVIKFQEDGTINVKINGTWTSVTVEGNAYDELTEFASQATIGPFGTALAFDTSGNLYWAVSNYYNGTTYNLTSYVYKITPDGILTVFASQSTNGAWGTDLIFDTSGNLYWAIGNDRSDASYSVTSYIYKITPGGTKTTFASQAAAGGRDTALAFDTSGNLYWSFINFYDGTTYNKICYVYKITPDGTKTTFASQLATGGLGTDLIFDIAGTLYWALGNFGNYSVYAQTSYVYKITPDGTKTNFASCKTDGAGRTALAFDSSSNLYWSVTNYGNATARNATSFIFKINQSGTKTTFASQSGFGTVSSTLVFGGNNLYWALMNYGESTSPCQNSYIYVKSL